MTCKFCNGMMELLCSGGSGGSMSSNHFSSTETWKCKSCGATYDKTGIWNKIPKTENEK